MINLKNLTFGYSNGKKIFNNLNFSIKEGDRIGLIGPNGAGKTTLLHLIMGLLKPDSGEIEIFGKIRKEEQDFIEVRQRIGLLFQDSDDQLFCPTVEEDIAFGPLNLGKSHEETRLIVKETCRKLGLNGYEKKVTHKLSGGEKRLVATCNRSCHASRMLSLDEPATGLDEDTTIRLLNYLKENTHTFLIITHDYNF